MSLEALTGVPQRSLHTSEQSSGMDTAGILAPTQELAKIEPSGVFYRLPGLQKHYRTEEQPIIACGSGAQFGGGGGEGPGDHPITRERHIGRLSGPHYHVLRT